MNRLIHGDFYNEIPKLIEQNIKVDLIIADLPYGMTQNKWDNKIDLKLMWDLLNKIKKDKYTPIILFGDFPFSIELIMSNNNHYRYTWYWNKQIGTGFLDSAYKPLKVIEHIHVFIETPFYKVESKLNYKKWDRIANFYPQMLIGNINHSTGTKLAGNNGTTYGNFKSANEIKITNSHITTFYRNGLNIVEKKSNEKHPNNLLSFQKTKPNKLRKYHPTEKPLQLIEYLVKTYSKENDLVLDFVAGSGVLAHACKNNNRNYIVIEKEEEYIKMIKERLNNLV